MNIWSASDLPPNATQRYRIGLLTLWLERDRHEWRIAHEVAGPYGQTPEEDERNRDLPVAGPEPAEKPGHLDWRRILYAAGSACLLAPVLPDRPIVVRPAVPLIVPPKTTAEVFVSIPLWVRVEARDGPRSIALGEYPTVTLSNTWFGLPTAGELAYSLLTSARRSLEGARERPHRAVCAISVRNETASDLVFQRLALRVEGLSVFAGEAHLWTSRLAVQFLGEDHPAVMKALPPPGGAGTELSPPRVRVQGNVLKASFNMLRSLAGL